MTDRVQPRVGFSWSPNPGTVVRGGYGLFSALNQGSTYYAMRVENGVVQVNYNYTGCQSSVGPTPAGAKTPNRCTSVPSASNSLQYPFVPFQVTGPALSSALFPNGGSAPAVNGPTIKGPQSFHGLDPNFVPPLAHEFHASVEQSLPGQYDPFGRLRRHPRSTPAVFVDSNLIGQTPARLRLIRPSWTRAVMSLRLSSCRSICSQIVATQQSPPSTPASVLRIPGTTLSLSPSAAPSAMASRCWVTTPGLAQPTPAR